MKRKGTSQEARRSWIKKRVVAKSPYMQLGGNVRKEAGCGSGRSIYLGQDAGGGNPRHSLKKPNWL